MSPTLTLCRRVALALLALVATTVAADPPARVARLAYIDGSVSLAPAGDETWYAATINRPLTTGDRIWTDNGARAELQLANGVVRLAPGTNAVLSNLDDRTAQIWVYQGSADVRVRHLASGEVFEIDTPNLAFVIREPGRYRLDVDANGNSTLAAVRTGAADVYGDRESYSLAGGQAYRFYDTDLRGGEYVSLAAGDPFDRWVGERDRYYTRTPSYVSSDVIGYEDLDRYGTWRRVADYGNVWIPRDVPSGWAPYRNGHWSWIEPWGWTWVDDARWGFAPFHYGRWAYLGNSWAWVPGPVNVQPVYAPALVAFVGGSNFSLSVSSGPAIGWFPLAPGEIYRPGYRVSDNYVRQVNVTNTVINNTVINNITVNNAEQGRFDRSRHANLRAPNALTAVAPATFVRSQPVARAAVAVPVATLERAEITPTARVTPERTSVAGAAPQARAKPPAAVERREIVAKAPPPPAPVPVSQRMAQQQQQQQQQQQPQAQGQPQQQSAGQPVVRESAPATAAKPPGVRMVESSAAPKPVPKPARDDDSRNANAKGRAGEGAAAARNEARTTATQGNERAPSPAPATATPAPAAAPAPAPAPVAGPAPSGPGKGPERAIAPTPPVVADPTPSAPGKGQDKDRERAQRPAPSAAAVPPPAPAPMPAPAAGMTPAPRPPATAATTPPQSNERETNRDKGRERAMNQPRQAPTAAAPPPPAAAPAPAPAPAPQAASRPPAPTPQPAPAPQAVARPPAQPAAAPKQPPQTAAAGRTPEQQREKGKNKDKDKDDDDEKRNKPKG